MAKLILLLCTALIVWILLVQWRNTPPEQRKKRYWQYLLGAAIAILLLLTVMGKLSWLGAAAAAVLAAVRALLPQIMRLLPGLIQGLQSGDSTGTRSIKTQVLDLLIDSYSHRITGKILSGPFAGLALGQLDESQLRELIRFCQQHDSESYDWLNRFYQQRFGSNNQPPSGIPTPEECYQILGINPGASKEEIIQAHRRLMQKVHPDRGGSDYLAARINLAKDTLLKSMA